MTPTKKKQTNKLESGLINPLCYITEQFDSDMLLPIRYDSLSPLGVYLAACGS